MPATLEQIAHFLDSPYWTESEKWVIRWQFNCGLQLLGDFETALAEAMKRADEVNLSRLSQGFPVQVAGYRAWAHGDLGRRLRKAGLAI